VDIVTTLVEHLYSISTTITFASECDTYILCNYNISTLSLIYFFILYIIYTKTIITMKYVMTYVRLFTQKFFSLFF